jgi:hypothetical protein
MNTLTTPIQLAENLWVLAYPLKMLGADLHRNVVLTRLRSGKLIIHSTAAFFPENVAAIHVFGGSGWLLDGILRNDTFDSEGPCVSGDSLSRSRWILRGGRVCYIPDCARSRMTGTAVAAFQRSLTTIPDGILSA